jgi:SagB-type dehydrogenase family enzyme
MTEESLTAAHIAVAIRRAKMELEQERRARFGAFGIAADCLWPCSRLFHAHSSLGPSWIPALSVPEVEALTRDGAYKRYLAADRIALPHPPPITASIEHVIRARRSHSEFSARPVTTAQLAKLLELGCGITGRDTLPARRAAPSGGALYPVEMYPVAFHVDGIQSGIYHYLASDHVLERVHAIDGLHETSSFLPPQLVEGGPALMLALSAVFARTQLKYLERGYRFALLEAGHIAQNLVLAAGAMGLGAVTVGGFWDEPFNEFLGLQPENEAVLYAVLIGNTA